MNLFCVFAVLILFDNVCSFKILIPFPIVSKSLHNLMSSIGLALAEAGHSVTHLTSFDPYVTHKNITHLQPENFAGLIMFKSAFDLDSQLAVIKFVDTLVRTIPHKLWAREEIWNLYEKRNEFDAIIMTSYANEALLPFVDGFNGAFVIVCTPGVEYECLSYSGNSATLATVPSMILPYDNYMTFGERIQSSLTLAIYRVFEQLFMEPTFLQSIRDYFPEFDDVREHVGRNHLTLINGHFSMDGSFPLLPKQVEIGTINAKKPKPLPKDLQAIYDEAGPTGVIFFSLGTFVNATDIPEKRRDAIIEAFRRLPHKIIWKHEDPKGLDLPPNVHTRNWLPQQDILGHPKTRIFMSHCGNLGTQEANFHGVPVLAVPISLDQPRNAARLERKGYGIIVNWNEMTVEKILEAVHTLTKDTTYYDRMKEVSRLVQDQKESPAERAVWWVEYAIRNKMAPQLQYAGKRLNFFQQMMMDVLAVWLVAIAVLSFCFIWTCKIIFRKCFGSSSKAKKD